MMSGEGQNLKIFEERVCRLESDSVAIRNWFGDNEEIS